MELTMRTVIRWATAAAGVGAFAAVLALATPTGAGAATGDPVLHGTRNISGNTTLIDIADPAQEPYALQVLSGTLLDWVQVGGQPGRDSVTAMNTYSNARAIFASAITDQAATYTQNTGNGPALYANVTSPTATAILGMANKNGRGARLRGGAAQLYLEPGTASTHPAQGLLGDIYLDKSGRLWLCKGGSSWKQIA
jgi:hypothetical protein